MRARFDRQSVAVVSETDRLWPNIGWISVDTVAGERANPSAYRNINQPKFGRFYAFAPMIRLLIGSYYNHFSTLERGVQREMGIAAPPPTLPEFLEILQYSMKQWTCLKHLRTLTEFSPSPPPKKKYYVRSGILTLSSHWTWHVYAIHCNST